MPPPGPYGPPATEALFQLFIAQELHKAIASMAQIMARFAAAAVRLHPELVAELLTPAPAEDITLDQLRAAIGADGATMPRARFDAEGGFSLN